MVAFSASALSASARASSRRWHRRSFAAVIAAAVSATACSVASASAASPSYSITSETAEASKTTTSQSQPWRRVRRRNITERESYNGGGGYIDGNGNGGGIASSDETRTRQRRRQSRRASFGRSTSSSSSSPLSDLQLVGNNTFAREFRVGGNVVTGGRTNAFSGAMASTRIGKGRSKGESRSGNRSCSRSRGQFLHDPPPRPLGLPRLSRPINTPGSPRPTRSPRSPRPTKSPTRAVVAGRRWYEPPERDSRCRDRAVRRWSVRTCRRCKKIQRQYIRRGSRDPVVARRWDLCKSIRDGGGRCGRLFWKDCFRGELDAGSGIECDSNEEEFFVGFYFSIDVVCHDSPSFDTTSLEEGRLDSLTPESKTALEQGFMNYFNSVELYSSLDDMCGIDEIILSVTLLQFFPPTICDDPGNENLGHYTRNDISTEDDDARRLQRKQRGRKLTSGRATRRLRCRCCRKIRQSSCSAANAGDERDDLLNDPDDRWLAEEGAGRSKIDASRVDVDGFSWIHTPPFGAAVSYQSSDDVSGTTTRWLQQSSQNGSPDLADELRKVGFPEVRSANITSSLLTDCSPGDYDCDVGVGCCGAPSCKCSPVEASPSSRPASSPSPEPTAHPFSLPTASPSVLPSVAPSSQPSMFQSIEPSIMPSMGPSASQSGEPSISSEPSPRYVPSESPSTSHIPSSFPTDTPSTGPTAAPSGESSVSPSSPPTAGPSAEASRDPSMLLSDRPSSRPSASPSLLPTAHPYSLPSASPSVVPIMLPSSTPTMIPSDEPSIRPSACPSASLPEEPSISSEPSPRHVPSESPSTSSSPSISLTRNPSLRPTAGLSADPSIEQMSLIPTEMASNDPTAVASAGPSGMTASLPATLLPSLHPT